MNEYAEERGRVNTKETVHGVNPAYLIGKVIRERIFDSRYYKEECFGLDAATLCDRAVDLQYIGGSFGNNMQISPFLCLVFKLIQLQPEKEIVEEYLNQKDFKYLTAMACFYIRLFYEPDKVYQTLEPKLNDYRKLRYRKRDGVELTYMDEFVDSLLNNDVVCDVKLPFLPSRVSLEDQELLEPRESVLASELESSDGSSSDSDS